MANTYNLYSSTDGEVIEVKKILMPKFRHVYPVLVAPIIGSQPISDQLVEGTIRCNEETFELEMFVENEWMPIEVGRDKLDQRNINDAARKLESWTTAGQLSVHRTPIKVGQSVRYWKGRRSNSGDREIPNVATGQFDSHR